MPKFLLSSLLPRIKQLLQSFFTFSLKQQAKHRRYLHVYFRLQIFQRRRREPVETRYHASVRDKENFRSVRPSRIVPRLKRSNQTSKSREESCLGR